MPSENAVAPAGTEHSTLYAAVEVSRKGWVVGLKSPLGERIGLHSIGAADVEGLKGLVEHHRAKVECARQVPTRVRDGVPLRRLEAAGKPRRRGDGERRVARSLAHLPACDQRLPRPRLIDAAAGKLTAAQVIDAIAAAGEVAPRVEGRIVRLD